MLDQDHSFIAVFSSVAAFADAICNPIAYQSQAEKRQQQLNALMDEEEENGEVRKLMFGNIDRITAII